MTYDEQFNTALDFILELVGNDDRICEELLQYTEEREYCSQNCQNLNNGCILRFLEHYKKKERRNNK